MTKEISLRYNNLCKQKKLKNLLFYKINSRKEDGDMLFPELRQLIDKGKLLACGAIINSMNLKYVNSKQQPVISLIFKNELKLCRKLEVTTMNNNFNNMDDLFQYNGQRKIGFRSEMLISDTRIRYLPPNWSTSKWRKWTLNKQDQLELTREAREGKLDPVIGRNKEIQNTKNNPVLVGDRIW